MKTVLRIVEVHVAWLVIVPSPQCITWHSQYELILFVALSSLRVLRLQLNGSVDAVSLTLRSNPDSAIPSLSPPSAPEHFPACPPTRFSQPPGAAPQPRRPKQPWHHHINTHLQDK